jgi:hypothetical protein
MSILAPYESHRGNLLSVVFLSDGGGQHWKVNQRSIGLFLYHHILIPCNGRHSGPGCCSPVRPEHGQRHGPWSHEGHGVQQTWWKQP